MFSSNQSNAAAAAAVNYIEDVFSTYLYTGTNAALTITNNIDLSGKGGLVWCKARTGGTVDHALSDTVQGRAKFLISNSSAAGGTVGVGDNITSFNSTGFSLGTDNGTNFNSSGDKMVSWTFREQPKFFDVVTYTGTGSNTTIAHALGAVPGSIIVKRTDAAAAWAVYHRSLANTQYMVLNTYAAAATGATWWNSTTPTSAVFSVGTDASVNASGGTYVAYIFAHDAGGFGLAGTDNVISCGSFTTDASGGCNVNLGYEPQWILSKSSTIAVPWAINDTMRGFTSNNTNNSNLLDANTSGAEYLDSYLKPTSTGFSATNQLQASAPYIYIAIRRGPMKVPTTGTSVFSPNASSGSTGTALVTNFPVDLSISTVRSGDTRFVSDRLRGVNSPGLTANQPWIATDSTGAELTNASIPRGWDNTQITVPPYFSGSSAIWWNFRRAPSFFDEVCYTGVGYPSNTLAHNLAAVPELMIIKRRSSAGANWYVYTAATSNANRLQLNTTDAIISTIYAWNSTTPTASYFYVGDDGGVNGSGSTYVAYLFATCAGVSKVGSYTGNGTTQTIDCGFTGGARFVLIKRTDSTGDWYVWDSARGIIAGNDPYLLLNSTAAEVTSTDYIDTYSAGFEISSTAPAAINASAGTYIFLAIA